MLTTESLKQMLDKDQNQDEVLLHLKISCSRALAEAILRRECLTIKLEEDEQ